MRRRPTDGGGVRPRVLDTQVLIDGWRRCRAQVQGPVTERKVRNWAQQVIDLYKSNAIVTPVAIEFLAGFGNASELRHGELLLAAFDCLDQRDIRTEDWDESYRLARRVPRDGKPRQLGDCLIRAIANRLKREVQTRDTGFPR